MSKTNLVVVAGGLNTRFQDLQKFPKLLLPTENDGSILLHYTKARELFNSVTFIVNEKYYDMVKDYINVVIGYVDGIAVVKSTNVNGSYNTIKSVVDELPDEDVLYVWSDLVIDDIEAVARVCEDSDQALIFTHDGKYRFKYENHELKPAEHGNVPGVYFLKHNKLAVPLDEKTNYDLVEDMVGLKGEELPSTITEYRDLDIYREKYLNYASKPNQTRFFNKIVDNGDGTLTKTCVDPKFNKLIERECDWYYKANLLRGTHGSIPKIHKLDKENKSITMEKVEGKTLYDHIMSIRDDSDALDAFVNKYIGKIEDMHSAVCTTVGLKVMMACNHEFFIKVLDRCDSISHIIDGYDRDDLHTTLQNAFVAIEDELGDKYNVFVPFCHGDLNGSNVLVRPNGDIVFIDPRGYFGDMEMYFPDEYDFAKVLYMFSGYDDFNTGRYIYYTSDRYDAPKELCDLSRLPEVVNNKTTRIMVAIIWIALAQYIAQDILKANIAYHHGLAMLKNELEK